MNHYKTDTLDLRLMDCMDLMREFPDKHFDLAIVDPPYGLGDRLSDGGGVLEKRAYVQMYREKKWDTAPTSNYFFELKRISKNQIIWGGIILIYHLLEELFAGTRCKICQRLVRGKWRGLVLIV